jgi:hypothetical protein
MTYDALGRPRAVTTQPYGAALITDFSGDRVLVKDPAGRERVTRSDALGRVTEVWEVTPQESGGEASTVNITSFPEHPEASHGYLTSYKYDALGNLRMVEQAGQHLGQAVVQRRFFAYDSLGRLLRAMSGSSLALATLGTGVNVTRVLVFSLSAALAGVAGALYAGFAGSTSGSSFPAFSSLLLVVILAIAGRGEVLAPIVAAFAMHIMPSYLNQDAFQDLFPGRVVHYKTHVRPANKVPPDASVVCFSGKPRPHQINWSLPLGD